MQDFRLKVFRTVAEKLNFTSAAEALFLTQPAVTLQIKTLEEDLGMKLFDRSHGKVRLTEAGELLVGYAKQIADLYHEAETALGSLIGEDRGRLAIGASTTIAQYILPPLISNFLSKNPKIEFSMISANTENIVKALDTNEINLGLVEGPTGRINLKAEPFLEDEIVVIAAANHEWALHDNLIIDVDQLAKIPLIFRERGSGTRQVVENALKKGGLKLAELNIVMELDSTEAIKSVVEANLGIGFVSRFGLTREIELKTLKIIKINNLEITRRLQFIYPPNPRQDKVVENFYRFLRRSHPLKNK